MNGADTDLLKQIHAARRYNLDGLILFDYAHTNEKYINVLTESVFKPYKKESIQPIPYSHSSCSIEQKEDKKRGRRK
jgi:hypothetical protein